MNAKRVIKTIMSAKKIKSGFVADKLGMDKQAFYNWLNRETGVPLEKLESVADVIGCDVVLIDRDTGEVYK